MNRYVYRCSLQQVAVLLIFTQFPLYLPKTCTDDDEIESANSHLARIKTQGVVQLRHYKVLQVAEWALLYLGAGIAQSVRYNDFAAGWKTGVSSLGVRRSGREAEHSVPIRTVVKNASELYVCMAWC